MKRGSEMTAEKATAQEATRKVAFAKVLAIQIIAYVVLVALALVPGMMYGDAAQPAAVPVPGATGITTGRSSPHPSSPRVRSRRPLSQ